MHGKGLAKASKSKYIVTKKRFAVTKCNDNLYMSWGGSEKNHWFQLDISIIKL